MKNFVLFILLTISVNVFAQQYKGDNLFSKIIVAEGKSVTDIRLKIREWVSENYNDAQKVIDLDTDEKMIIKGISKISYIVGDKKMDFECKTAITFTFKDERFKTDIKYHSYYSELEGWDEINGELESLMTDKPLEKEDFFNIITESYTRNASKYGVTKDEMLKMAKNTLSEKGDTMYKDHLASIDNHKKDLNSFFGNIKSKVVDESNDDW